MDDGQISNWLNDLQVGDTGCSKSRWCVLLRSESTIRYVFVCWQRYYATLSMLRYLADHGQIRLDVVFIINAAAKKTSSHR
ncbi:hypothetical protein O9993_01075 [Vibrio lentus]|nr:hypothetical protein [Vibrio lentus]